MILIVKYVQGCFSAKHFQVDKLLSLHSFIVLRNLTPSTKRERERERERDQNNATFTKNHFHAKLNRHFLGGGEKGSMYVLS